MFKTSILSLALLATAPAFSADLVTDAMQKAYVPYRLALFKTNSGSQPDSQQAIGQARSAWAGVVRQFGENVPAPYDRDPGFAASLAEVDKVYARAAAEIAQGKLPEAHETLEGARDVLAELRHRNNVSVFSDHMNAYHAQMELVLTEAPQALEAKNGLLELGIRVGALDYLAARLASEAPAGLAADAEFKAALAAVRQSVTELKLALLAQDRAKAGDAIGKLKQPYSKMFIKFG